MKTVTLRHPGYDDDCNVLLALPALDHPDGGIHAETARIACCIIADNRWDGFLSATRQDAKPVEPEDGVLRGEDYYFHLPSLKITHEGGETDDNLIDKRKAKIGPYPITVRFDDWTFPARGLPAIWQGARAAIERMADEAKGTQPQNEHGEDIADGACNLCGAAEEWQYSWLWASDERRVFARECAKISVNELLRLPDSDDSADDSDDSDEEEDEDESDEGEEGEEDEEDEEESGKVEVGNYERDEEDEDERNEVERPSSENSAESEDDGENEQDGKSVNDEGEADDDGGDEDDAFSQSEAADPLDNDLNLIRLGVDCSALPHDFDATRTFDRYQWLFVPKFEDTGDPILSAHLFLTDDENLSAIHDKPLLLPWKSSIEMHFSHFAQAVFAGLTSFLNVEADRTLKILDAEDRAVLVDAPTQLVKALVLQKGWEIWEPRTSESGGNDDASEQSSHEDNEGEESAGVDAADPEEQNAENQTTGELKEVSFSAEKWQQALAELAQDLQDIDNDDTQSELVPETVRMIAFPDCRCTDCGEAIYGTMYQSLDLEEHTLCSDCIANDGSKHAEEVFVPIYDSPWLEDVPTGKMIPRQDSSNEDADSDEDAGSQEADEIDEEDEELTPDELTDRLSREVPDLMPFAYSDALLDAKPPQIRLFCLEPASADGPICGHLETVTLTSDTPFEALSYCWGPMEPECHISVGGARFRVTPSLKLALYRLRDAEDTRKFWIDAICIDQTNLEEKSHQILLMRDIYFHARQTIVWLGEEGEHSQTALGMCSRLFSAYGNAYIKQQFGVDVEALYMDFLNTRPKRPEPLSDDADESASIEAFTESFDLEKSFEDSLSSLVSLAMTKEEEYAGPGKELVDIALNETAEQIRLEELRVGYVTGIDPADPTYFEKLGEMFGDQLAQGIRWNGPFKEDLETGAREGLELDEAGWEQYWIDRTDGRDDNNDGEGGESSQDVDETPNASVISDDKDEKPASPSAVVDTADAEDTVESESARQSTSMSRQRMVTQILQNRSANKSKTIAPPSGDEIAAMHKFFGRPWFRRIWIVQEVALSRDILVQCGPRTIDWSAFELGYLIASKLRKAARTGSSTQRNTVYMSQLRAEVLSPPGGKDSGSLQLLPLLVKFRRYFATDARDKVFALLGLTRSDPSDLGLRPDYYKSVEEVYTEVARGFLLHLPRLDILWVPRDTDSPDAKDLPTWVPDWSDTGPKAYPLAGTEQFQAGVDMRAALRIFTASSDSKPAVAFDGPRRLQLRGYVFDDISEIAAAVSLDEDNTTFPLDTDSVAESPRSQIAKWNKFVGDIQSYIAVVEEWKKFAGIDGDDDAEARYPRTNEDSFTVFARTAWTDMDRRHYLDDCREWLDTAHYFGELFADIAPVDVDIEDEEELTGLFVNAVLPLMLRFDPAKLSELQGGGGRHLKCCHVLSRRLARTRNGDLCLVPRDTRVGDHLSLLQGGGTPFVLRRTTSASSSSSAAEVPEFRLVGETYVHGIMYGEAWEPDRCHTVTLV